MDDADAAGGRLPRRGELDVPTVEHINMSWSGRSGEFSPLYLSASPTETVSTYRSYWWSHQRTLVGAFDGVEFARFRGVAQFFNSGLVSRNHGDSPLEISGYRIIHIDSQ